MGVLNLEQAKRLWEAEKADEVKPCMAVWSVSLLYSLGFDDDGVQKNWLKLTGRPIGLVRWFVKRSSEARPELRQQMVTQFAKDYPRKGRG